LLKNFDNLKYKIFNDVNDDESENLPDSILNETLPLFLDCGKVWEISEVFLIKNIYNYIIYLYIYIYIFFLLYYKIFLLLLLLIHKQSNKIKM